MQMTDTVISYRALSFRSISNTLLDNHFYGKNDEFLFG